MPRAKDSQHIQIIYVPEQENKANRRLKYSVLIAENFPKIAKVLFLQIKKDMPCSSKTMIQSNANTYPGKLLSLSTKTKTKRILWASRIHLGWVKIPTRL